MDMVLCAGWLMKPGSYTTTLEEKLIEFNWQGQHYKLHGFAFNKDELRLIKQEHET